MKVLRHSHCQHSIHFRNRCMYKSRYSQFSISNRKHAFVLHFEAKKRKEFVLEFFMFMIILVFLPLNMAAMYIILKMDRAAKLRGKTMITCIMWREYHWLKLWKDYTCYYIISYVSNTNLCIHSYWLLKPRQEQIWFQCVSLNVIQFNDYEYFPKARFT